MRGNLIWSFGYCIVCPSSKYGFWLHLWYRLAIVLSVLPRYTYSDYTFGIFWPLYCLSFLDIRIIITLLVSFGHYIVCPFSIYGFWLPFWYLFVIILLVLPRYTDSDYTFGIFWPLYCLLFLDIEVLITPLVSFSHYIAYTSSIYGFWLPLWYLLAIIMLVLSRYTNSAYPFGIFWSLYCLSFLDIRILLTLLVSLGLSFLDIRILITFFGIFNLFSHILVQMYSVSRDSLYTNIIISFGAFLFTL